MFYLLFGQKLPPAIGLRMQGALAKSIILRDRYKNLWPVEVDRIGDGWYFNKGWAQFCKENSLERGDFMVFECKGGCLFDFKLLGHNECEKKGVGALKSRVKQKDQEEQKAEEEVQEEDEASVDSEEDDDNEDYVQEEGEDEEEEQVNNIYKKADPKNKSKSSVMCNRNLNGRNAFGIWTIPRKRSYQKKNVPECYGADIFKSGLAIKPQNPYFVTRSSTGQRKNELHIPKDVIVDYHLNIPEKLFLVDEEGRKYETKIKQWKDGRLLCTRGWRSLCNVNGIVRDDLCICEFVQGEDSEDLNILVHVVDGSGS